MAATFTLTTMQNESASQTTDWGQGWYVSSLLKYFKENDYGLEKRPIVKVTFEIDCNVTTNWGYATIFLKTAFANSSSDANYDSQSERFLYKEFRTDKEPNQTLSVDITKYFNRYYPYDATSETKGYKSLWVYFNTSSVNKKTYTVNYARIIVEYEGKYLVPIRVNPDKTYGTITGSGVSPTTDSYFHYNLEIVKDTTTELTATPAEGCNFLSWRRLSDGIFVYDNPYSFHYVGTERLVVEFEKKKFQISAEIFPEGAGIVDNVGEHSYGDEIALIAIPNEGYKFIKWSDGSTESTRYVQVTGDITYTAYFEELQMKIKSVKVFKNSENVLASPNTPLISGESAIVEIKMALE